MQRHRRSSFLIWSAAAAAPVILASAALYLNAGRAGTMSAALGSASFSRNDAGYAAVSAFFGCSAASRSPCWDVARNEMRQTTLTSMAATPSDLP